MENLNSFLISINKISILASFFVFFILLYEVFLVHKERKVRGIKIPDFTDKVNYSREKLEIQRKKSDSIKTNRWILFLTVFLLVFLGLISIAGFMLSNKLSKDKSIYVKERTYYLGSKGIFIFDEKWNNISEQQLISYKNKVIIIGIEVPKKLLSEIDMARIRVNKDRWSIDDITTDFNKEKLVFYKKYKVPGDCSAIKIKAQLHSRISGWLGN